MDEVDIMIATISSTNKNCSQIMCELIQGVTLKKNDELIKVLYALGDGVHAGKTCGIVTGGAIAINLLAKDNSIEENLKFKKMINEYVEWFENTFSSVECATLDPEKKREVCSVMLKESFLKILSIFEENNIDLYD